MTIETCVECEIDLAHPADTEHLQDAIGTNGRADRRGGSRWRMLEELSRFLVRLEKRFHLGPERIVSATCVRQKGRPLPQRTIERRLKQLFHFAPSVGS